MNFNEPENPELDGDEQVPNVNEEVVHEVGVDAVVDNGLANVVIDGPDSEELAFILQQSEDLQIICREMEVKLSDMLANTQNNSNSEENFQLPPEPTMTSNDQVPQESFSNGLERLINIIEESLVEYPVDFIVDDHSLVDEPMEPEVDTNVALSRDGRDNAH